MLVEKLQLVEKMACSEAEEADSTRCHGQWKRAAMLVAQGAAASFCDDHLLLRVLANPHLGKIENLYQKAKTKMIIGLTWGKSKASFRNFNRKVWV
jgi:hypothetical protein